MQEKDENGVRVARRYAQWHLGSSYWADAILEAYFSPDTVAARLEAEKSE